MRYTGRKGWQASRKDTWSLDATLDPIIAAGLVKFKKVITGDCCAGLPSAYVSWDAQVGETEGEFERQFDLWVADIDKMIYAFQAPDVEYDLGWVDGPEHGVVDIVTGYIRYNKIPADEKAWKQHLIDGKLHADKQIEGRKLFAMALSKVKSKGKETAAAFGGNKIVGGIK